MALHVFIHRTNLLSDLISDDLILVVIMTLVESVMINLVYAR